MSHPVSVKPGSPELVTTPLLIRPAPMSAPDMVQPLTVPYCVPASNSMHAVPPPGVTTTQLAIVALSPADWT